MKPYEVGMFKRFLNTIGADEMFVGCYRTRRWKANPESIEEYLYKSDVKDVCLRAFYFLLNNRCGYDYWESVQQRWENYLEKNYDEEHSKDWKKLRGVHRHYICTNWDNKQWWHINNRTDTAARVSALLVKLGMNEYVTDIKEEVEVEEPKLEEENLLAKFGLVDITDVTARSNGARLKPNTISINSGKGTHKITFNNDDTEFVVKNGDFHYANIMINTNKDVFIVFSNDDKGLNVSRTKSAKGEPRNLVLCSKNMVAKVQSVLHIQDDYSNCNVKMVGNNEKCIIYQVTL